MNIGIAFLLKCNVVTLAYLCGRATSKRVSSRRLVSAEKF